MMAQLFQSHPQVAMGNESEIFSFVDSGLFYYCLRTIVRMYRRGRILTIPCVLQPGFLSPRLLSFYVNAGFFAALIAQGRGKVTMDRIERVLKGLSPTKLLVGDKFPDYVFKMDELTRMPGVKCIVMVRDARDVAASTKEAVVQWNAPWTKVLNTPAKVARRWSRTVNLAARNSDTSLTVRYEELVKDPRAVMTRVANWLGIDPEGFVLESVHADSVGSYTSRLSPQEIAQVERIAGAEMRALGYL